MESIANCIDKILGSLDPKSADAVKVASLRNRYRDAIKSIWKDNAVSSMMLEHTNAFYVREDERLRRGGDKGIVCEVCIDDAMVRSELDTHRELFEFALRSNGLEFDEFRIISAKGNMRHQHPFIDKKSPPEQE